MLFSVKFIKDAIEQAITAAAASLLGSSVVLDIGAFSADNLKVAAVVGLGVILKAIVATRVGDKESTSIVP